MVYISSPVKYLAHLDAWLATQPTCAATSGTHAATAIRRLWETRRASDLPSRDAPPVSSPRPGLVKNASRAAFHVKVDLIERAGLHLVHLWQHGQARDVGMSRQHAQHARTHLSRIAGAAAVPGTSAEAICSFAAHTAASWRISLAGAVFCAERRTLPFFSALPA